MSKPREQDLKFLQQHKDNLFNSKNHILRILRGRIPVPRDPIDINAPLDNYDFNGMTFGQFVSWQAQQKGYLMKDLANAIGIPIDVVEQIYDDQLFPWDLDPGIVSGLSQLLHIPITRMKQLIRGHRMDPSLLRKRLAGGASAARTHFTLGLREREEGLIQTDLIIQKDRENEKRDRFLKTLEE